jgi:hypothetical protein
VDAAMAGLTAATTGLGAGNLGLSASAAVSANITDTTGIMARQSNEAKRQTDLLERSLAELREVNEALRARSAQLVTV